MSFDQKLKALRLENKMTQEYKIYKIYSNKKNKLFQRPQLKKTGGKRRDCLLEAKRTLSTDTTGSNTRNLTTRGKNVHPHHPQPGYVTSTHFSDSYNI